MVTRAIFRQESLDRLAAPDELDRLLVVIRFRAWIPLAALGLLCAAAVVWSFLGRIPITVNGLGVLINPGNVKGLQSQATGQLIELPLRVGQFVKQGEVIGVINQPELRKQLEQAEAKLKELVAADAASDQLDEVRAELENTARESQRAALLKEIAKIEPIAEAIRAKDTTYREAQRKNLDRTKQLSTELHASLQKNFDQLKSLKREGLAAGPLVLSSEREYTESQLRLANLEVQLRELDLREIEGAEKFLVQQNRLSDLTLQIRQLDVAAQRLRQQIVESNLQRENLIQDARRQIERLKLDLERQSRIVSQYTGRVLEIAMSAGQMVSAGDRLATVEVARGGHELKNLAYFDVKDGKLIEPGMPVRVTPSTVLREREGAIVGTVTKVSSFPITQQGAANVVGSKEIATLLTRSGGMIEVEADLERDDEAFSGYRWTSQGPRLHFSAGTTTTVRITVGQRRPISYALPILRTWLYGEKDEGA